MPKNIACLVACYFFAQIDRSCVYFSRNFREEKMQQQKISCNLFSGSKNAKKKQHKKTFTFNLGNRMPECDCNLYWPPFVPFLVSLLSFLFFIFVFFLFERNLFRFLAPGMVSLFIFQKKKNLNPQALCNRRAV